MRLYFCYIQASVETDVVMWHWSSIHNYILSLILGCTGCTILISADRQYQGSWSICASYPIQERWHPMLYSNQYLLLSLYDLNSFMHWEWKTFDKKPGLRAIPTSMDRAVEGIMAKWAERKKDKEKSDSQIIKCLLMS